MHGAGAAGVSSDVETGTLRRVLRDARRWQGYGDATLARAEAALDRLAARAAGRDDELDEAWQRGREIGRAEAAAGRENATEALRGLDVAHDALYRLGYRNPDDPKAEAERGLEALRTFRAALDEAGDGVAEATCPICGHEWRRHDPEDGCCDAPSAEHAGVCDCGRDMAWMHTKTAALSRAALGG